MDNWTEFESSITVKSKEKCFGEWYVRSVTDLLRLSSLFSSIWVFGFELTRGKGWWWGDVRSSPGLFPLTELPVRGIVTLELDRAPLLDVPPAMVPRRPGPEQGRLVSTVFSKMLLWLEGICWWECWNVPCGLRIFPVDPGVESMDAVWEAVGNKCNVKIYKHFMKKIAASQKILRTLLVKSNDRFCFLIFSNISQKTGWVSSKLLAWKEWTPFSSKDWPLRQSKNIFALWQSQKNSCSILRDIRKNVRKNLVILMASKIITMRICKDYYWFYYSSSPLQKCQIKKKIQNHF